MRGISTHSFTSQFHGTSSHSWIMPPRFETPHFPPSRSSNLISGEPIARLRREVSTRMGHTSLTGSGTSKCHSHSMRSLPANSLGQGCSATSCSMVLGAGSMRGHKYLPKRAPSPNCRYDRVPMEPQQWLSSFRLTHENYKRGILNEGDQRKYMGMRDELARSIMQSQGSTAPEGIPARRAFKVAHVFQIELGGVSRTTTREISCLEFT